MLECQKVHKNRENKGESSDEGNFVEETQRKSKGESRSIVWFFFDFSRLSDIVHIKFTYKIYYDCSYSFCSIANLIYPYWMTSNDSLLLSLGQKK